MEFVTMGQMGSIVPYLRKVPTLSPGDSVEQAIERLRRSPVGQVPVVTSGRVIGIFSEDCLQGFHARRPEGASATEVVERLMKPVRDVLPDYAPAEQALGHMELAGLTVIPVVNAMGQYVGMVSRADLIAIARGVVRPPRAGGMATPLGVYLTTGAVRAGAGDLGLFLTGAMLTVVLVLAAQVAAAAVWLADRLWGTSIYSALLARQVQPDALAPDVQMLAFYAVFGVAFLALFRFGPLGGYHAAEHMTVNALEQGEELVLEKVSRMPRVHKRCGTNIAVVFFVLWVALDAFRVSQLSLAFLVLVLLLGRTALGGAVQQWVTTRPPRAHELANGIAVGRELVARYQPVAGRPVSLARRLWNMGVLQVLAGLAVAFAAVNALAQALHFQEFLIMPF